jgi:predicted DNA-binding protein (MmcQ/YjbR family)
MTPEQLLAHCLAKPGARQDEPWEGDVVVKVGGKLPKKDRPAGS